MVGNNQNDFSRSERNPMGPKYCLILMKKVEAILTRVDGFRHNLFILPV